MCFPPLRALFLRPRGLARQDLCDDEKPGAAMSWHAVYKVAKRVPRGCVITYGQLARMARIDGGARAVGRALASCPADSGIPWHRVVGAGGRILLQEPKAALQRRLLEAEKVQFLMGGVDLHRYAWEPKPRRRSNRTDLTRGSTRRAGRWKVQDRQ